MLYEAQFRSPAGGAQILKAIADLHLPEPVHHGGLRHPHHGHRQIRPAPAVAATDPPDLRPGVPCV